MTPSKAAITEIRSASSYHVKKRLVFRHREQSDVEESPHLQRFFLVGRALLIYLTAKLKIILGSVP